MFLKIALLSGDRLENSNYRTLLRFVYMGNTCVDEASRCAFAELFGFVGQRDLHHPGDVSGWSLHSDGVRGDEL